MAFAVVGNVMYEQSIFIKCPWPFSELIVFFIRTCAHCVCKSSHGCSLGVLCVCVLLRKGEKEKERKSFYKVVCFEEEAIKAKDL